jgi:hypothetical protein
VLVPTWRYLFLFICLVLFSARNHWLFCGSGSDWTPLMACTQWRLLLLSTARSLGLLHQWGFSGCLVGALAAIGGASVEVFCCAGDRLPPLVAGCCMSVSAVVSEARLKALTA